LNPVPEGSQISVEIEDGLHKLIIPQPSGGVARFFAAAFLTVWLVGWAFGWVSAYRGLTASGDQSGGFMLFWLVGWSIGGIFALAFLFRLARPSQPETLILSRPNLIYDTGLAPLKLSGYGNAQIKTLKMLFDKRQRLEFDATQLRTLALREHEAGSRLTIDVGHKRLELGAGATDPEREWLHATLTDKYRF